MRFRIRFLHLAVVLSCSTGLVFAQESGISGVQVLSISSGDEGLTEEMRDKIAGGAAAFSFASPNGGFSIGSPFGGVDPNSRSQLFNLLSNESVRKELQLTDDQLGGAKQIMRASQERMTKMIRERMSQNTDGSKSVSLGGADFRELMAENQSHAEAAIEEILLPEQMERVRQLAYQIEVSQKGLGESLVSGRLGIEIGVHKDQKQHLLDRAKKIEAEALAAVVRIRAQARAALFQELTPEQRKAAEKLLGDYFKYEETSLGQQLRKSLKGMRTPPAKGKKE